MILHVFTQVSAYSIEFLNLLKEKFNEHEHIVVFRNSANGAEIADKFAVTLLFLDNRRLLTEQMPQLLQKADRIIFHSFPVSRSLIFWWTQRKYFHKVIWSVWGQDAYWFRYCSKTPNNLLYEWIRKQLIKKLTVILCPISGDHRYILQNYKTKAVHHKAMYPIPTDFAFLNSIRNTAQQGSILQIQVGNSANPTNNTIEVLAFLKKHMDQDFRVYCPLSYGDKEYAEKVIKFGREQLGDHFVPLTKFMNKVEYAQFIVSMDVLILNHDRQQGLGNIFSYLFLGKKVYIRKDNSSFDFFREHQIIVHDTIELIKSDQYDTMSAKDDESIINIENTAGIISLDRIASDWNPILKILC